MVLGTGMNVQPVHLFIEYDLSIIDDPNRRNRAGRPGDHEIHRAAVCTRTDQRQHRHTAKGIPWTTPARPQELNTLYVTLNVLKDAKELQIPAL